MTEITPQRLPYRLRKPFLATTEMALYRLLKELMGDRYAICPKVALNDIFYIVRPNENVHFFNKFFRKHVDFLLCDRQTMSPIFGVEIVRPITKGEARESDKFVQELFTDAGLPLVHIPSQETYQPAEVITLFQLAVTRLNEAEEQQQDNPTDHVPLCPECGKMMVLRFERTGNTIGKKYYGCIDSPRCSGTATLD